MAKKVDENMPEPEYNIGHPTTDIEAIREMADEFRRVIKAIKPGKIETFRKANQTLGFNVAYGAIALLKEVARLKWEVARLEGQLAMAGQEKAALRADLRKAATYTPKYVGIPEEEVWDGSERAGVN